ncbi:MAG: DMT family transporter [Deltaproteobacteria bacterium]|nr:DMT family transporter [Deltaproteobacteria bacterium]
MRGSLYIAVSASLWGLWSLFFKSAERAAGAVPVSAQAEAAVVLAVMLLALLPRAVRDQRSAPRRSRAEWTRLAVVGALDGLNFWCFLLAMQRTTVAIAVLTHYLAPLVIALLAPIALREPWRLRTFAALALALIGLALLLQPWAHPPSAQDLSGAALGAASALCYGTSVVIQKTLVMRFSAWELGAFSKPIALMVLLLAMPSTRDLALEPTPLAWLVAGGVLCGALPLVLFFMGLGLTTASRAAVLTLCEPLVAVLVGALVWREPLGPWSAVGATFMLAAAGWIARGERPVPALGPSALSVR